MIRRSLGCLAVAVAVVFVPTSTATAAPGECVKKDPTLGYCVEWDTGDNDGSPGDGGGGGGGPAPVCFWVNIPPISDPTIYADFGLAEPPPGVVIQWQSWECSDGRPTFNFRWVFEVPPEDLAWGVRVRIVGTLADPALDVSPPLGTPSIISVPVFLAVSNWTGVITDSACGGGLCVTVTATPQLTFKTGEPGGTSIACSGAGTKFDRSRPPAAQASAPGACAHVYTLRTSAEGRPVEWAGSASVTWSIAWTSTIGQSGVLPSVTRSTPVPRAVQEVQTVVVGGSNP